MRWFRCLLVLCVCPSLSLRAASPSRRIAPNSQDAFAPSALPRWKPVGRGGPKRLALARVLSASGGGRRSGLGDLGLWRVLHSRERTALNRGKHMKLAIRTYIHIYAALLGVLVASEAMAVPLEDSGTHLSLTGNAIPTHLTRTVTGNTVTGPWTGSWAAPADAAWIGSFAVTGPVPAGTANNTGVSTYNFAGMPDGVLPDRTLFRFGDFDTGSCPNPCVGRVETITLSALDAGGVILDPWLEGLASYTPLGIDSTGSGAVVSDDLPGWDFDSATGVYTFDGQTVANVVNVAFAFENNIAMSQLVVNRNSEFANFTLGAPVVPEPGTMLLMGAGLAVAVLVGRKSLTEK